MVTIFANLLSYLEDLKEQLQHLASIVSISSGGTAYPCSHNTA